MQLYPAVRRHHFRLLLAGDDHQDDGNGYVGQEHVSGRLVESAGLLHRCGRRLRVLSAHGEPESDRHPDDPGAEAVAGD